ncbi:MAG: flagellar hook-basal body complex protein FliE [Euryarchaeota archaeon]|nr:flagellar hook-basal body complex protein FliE [Euryarchaeota archaeon]
MRIVAITGLPGSGKSEAVRIAREHGLPVVRMGDFVIDEVRRRGLPIEESAIGPVATGMRADHGDDIWARRTIEAIRSGRVSGIPSDEPLVIVDGVRSPAEVERFRADLGKEFILVAVDAPETVRHERLLGRRRHDDVRDVQEAKARDDRERRWGVEEVMSEADHILRNDSGLETFRKKADDLLDRLVARARPQVGNE